MQLLRQEPPQTVEIQGGEEVGRLRSRGAQGSDHGGDRTRRHRLLHRRDGQGVRDERHWRSTDDHPLGGGEKHRGTIAAPLRPVGE